MYHVYNGVDRLSVADPWIHGRRVGLLTAASGVNREGVPTYELLAKSARLEVLFAPEHGIRSNLQDGLWADNARDEETGAQIGRAHV